MSKSRLFNESWGDQATGPVVKTEVSSDVGHTAKEKKRKGGGFSQFGRLGSRNARNQKGQNKPDPLIKAKAERARQLQKETKVHDLNSYLISLPREIKGRQLFQLRHDSKQARPLTTPTGELIGFFKKTDAKRVRDELAERFKENTKVTVGPDHYLYENE